MKNIFKFTALVFVSLTFWACAGDPVFDTKLEKSDFFVSFRTFNNLIPSATIVEGDTTVVEISIGAARGNAITVDFEVRIPEVANSISAEYELLDMNDNPMTNRQLTFPDGTGSQQFKFVATDNDIVDGTRRFTLAITGNSAGYNIGVGSFAEASTFVITVRDDEVQMTIEELLGTWTVTDELGTMGWAKVTYDVTFEKVDDTTVKIIGFGDQEDVVLTATVSLLSKVKSITIPFQKMDVDWDDDEDVYFSANAWFGGNFGVGFDAVVIEKEDDGTIRFSLGSGYTWEFAATDVGTMDYLGPWELGYGTVFTKKP